MLCDNIKIFESQINNTFIGIAFKITIFQLVNFMIGYKLKN